ncbi:hypothetical protein [Antrihabitans stalactiti]|uniref:Uncharacterized protein n=1 Tax=Antrihabitans stalactiti TaxID=2584121 RepID=A0A848KB56_9NOCA|nr:hypothetical protein [Antrihabitans stalactiti]NMN94728.1 hypothetical protein [Antrihabitans stalactiti]
MIIAVATILITRLYLELTNYPQVGGGNLHIAHALYGGAMMMLALVFGWLFTGFGVRVVMVIVGGIGFGLFLDEVGKFVTKDNDYFYGPSAEIMYIAVALILVINRMVRDLRPPTPSENLASAAAIAADGVVHGLPDRRREWALSMVSAAEEGGADATAAAHVRSLIHHCSPASEKMYRLKEFTVGLVPGFLRSPRWVPIVGWLMVVASLLGLAFGALGALLGGVFYEDDRVTFELAGMSPATAILLVSAAITLALSLPAMLALRKTDAIWPLRMLRDAALTFTFLNALVDFATQGFAAVTNLAIGLFTLSVLSYHLRLRLARSYELSAPVAK